MSFTIFVKLPIILKRGIIRQARKNYLSVNEIFDNNSDMKIALHFILVLSDLLKLKLFI